MEKELEKQKRKKWNKKIIRLFGKASAIFVILLIVVYAGVRIFLGIGNSRINQRSEAKESAWQDGWIRYKGEVYEYNDKILTFLVMGIDKDGEVTGNHTTTDGGQSDALFLVIINSEDESIRILAIDRNTMTDIQMPGMGEGGTDIAGTGQIAVQHGFGDGKEGSCELTRVAVSKLLFNLPIHGYLSINYEAIPYINDAVGGVEVTLPKDVLGVNPAWTEGEQVLLMGHDAINFIRYRDITVFESARLRMLRQKQYLTTFASKAAEKMKEDITFPITLYQNVKNYIVTDLSMDEMAYLASEFAGYSFDEDHIYTMEGETVMGEMFEEFYPDMEALKEQVITLFYRKIESTDQNLITCSIKS